jgi:hypothetical protein
MQLVLSVGNKVLDRVEIRPDLSKNDDYLQSVRRLLITKNELFIIALQKDPTFYIEVESQLNTRK